MDGKEYEETVAQVIRDRTSKRFSELELRKGFGNATISLSPSPRSSARSDDRWHLSSRRDFHRAFRPTRPIRERDGSIRSKPPNTRSSSFLASPVVRQLRVGLCGRVQPMLNAGDDQAIEYLRARTPTPRMATGDERSQLFASVTISGAPTLIEEINAGRLKARKAGRRTIVTSDDADEWLSDLPALQGSSMKRPLESPPRLGPSTQTSHTANRRHHGATRADKACSTHSRQGELDARAARSRG